MPTDEIRAIPATAQLAEPDALADAHEPEAEVSLSLEGPAVIIAAQPTSLLAGCSWALEALIQSEQDVTIVVVEPIAPHPASNRQEALTRPPPENREASHQPTANPVTTRFWQDIPEGELYAHTTIERISALLAKSCARTVLAPSPEDPSAHASALGLAAREAVRRTNNAQLLVFYTAAANPQRITDGAVKKAISLGRPDDAASQGGLGPQRVPAILPTAFSLFEQYVPVQQADLITPVSGLAAKSFWAGPLLAATAPLVSVITRTTNRPELADTLDSIAAQTHRNIEVLLVDATGDGSIAARNYCGRFAQRVISRGKSLGRSAAANAGLDAAKGDYILFLDDDDWIHPDHIESLLQTIHESVDARAAYSNTVCVKRDQHDKWEILSYYDRAFDAQLLLVENYLPIHSVLFERALVERRLRFDEALDVYEDWDFWLQLSRVTDFAYSGRLTAVYRISATSGFGRRHNDPAATTGYSAVIAKWQGQWTPAEAEQIARDAASYRRGGNGVAQPSSLPRRQISARVSAQVTRRLQRRIRKQQDQIARYKETLSARSVKIRRLSDALDAMQQRVDEHRHQLDVERIARRELAEIHDRLAQALNRVQTSSYWRITAPVRLIDQKWPGLLRPVVAGIRGAWSTVTLRIHRRLRIRRTANVILRHGLFDSDWYVARYPDIVLRELNPLLHWIIGGWKEGRWPNPLFNTSWYLAEHPELVAEDRNPLEHFLAKCETDACDPNPLFHCQWYLEEYPEVAAAGINPLSHFLSTGAKEGYNPNPLFDTRWYLEQYPDTAASGINPLAQYLHAGAKEGRDPHPYFDSDWYLAQNPDVAQAEINPLTHYFWAGAAEARAPCEAFDPALYLENHPEVRQNKLNPLVHFLEEKRQRLRRLDVGDASNAARSAPLLSLYDGMLRAAQRQPARKDFVPEVDDAFEPVGQGVRVIAFYLPQFHPIPENDAWWGKGFTEWTNVSKAVPQFEGHYQPRLPEALGFYDLRLKEVQRAQIELAKKYGIYGFCYHHYWFAGKRLLERPLQQMLDDPSLDFPFCICWANENWTRRWDGCDEEVLLGQKHSIEDDVAFIAELEPALRDPRYIRVDGRPLLIVYRPQLFPNPAETAERWRNYLRQRGMPEPYLVNVWSFPGAVDPHSIGFDAAVEFPPHQYPCAEISDKFRKLNQGFEGRICDYIACVEYAEATRYQRRPFDLFPGVMTAWDNTPRRLEHGTVYADASPDAYQRWMHTAGERALDFEHADKRMVFVNAWNEWAEGTYLEPDRRYGYAYLQATREVLERLRDEYRSACAQAQTAGGKRAQPKLLLVGHDAHRHGAQLLALNLARLLVTQFGYKLEIWLLEEGELLPEYRRLAQVTVLSEGPSDLCREIRELRDKGFSSAITNTVVTGELVPKLKDAGFAVVSLIHEMPAFIRERALQQRAQALAAAADHLIFAAETVRRRFDTLARVPRDKAVILPQGIYQSLTTEPDARASLESELGLTHDATLVLNVGYGDRRKGFDWFADCAHIVTDADPRFHFLWVGKLTPEAQERFELDSRHGRLATHLHHLPFTDRIARYFAAADVFLLTSREDPFPSVVLEALASGLPVVAFEGSGGHCELLEQTPSLGALAAPMGDVRKLAATLQHTAAEDRAQPEHRRRRSQLARRRFSFSDYGWALLRRLDPTLRSVSVVVPNYNYAQHLQERLESIFHQTYPVYEVVVLDDASTDDSISVIRHTCEQCGRHVRLIENTANSGSVFRQWAKGVSEARGDLVWIAEADDLAKPQFLERMVSAVATHEDTLFAFADSAQIDEAGTALGASYADYCNEYSPLDFSADFSLPTAQFLEDAISVKNNILNVSAVLFRRDALTQALDSVGAQLNDWKISGDWRLYIELCKQQGQVAYVADALNTHRRHKGGVVGANDLAAHIEEIERLHGIIAAHFTCRTATHTNQTKYLSSLEGRARAEASPTKSH